MFLYAITFTFMKLWQANCWMPRFYTVVQTFALVDGTVCCHDNNDDEYIDAVRQKHSIRTGFSVLRNRCVMVQVPVMLKQITYHSLWLCLCTGSVCLRLFCICRCLCSGCGDFVIGSDSLSNLPWQRVGPNIALCIANIHTVSQYNAVSDQLFYSRFP